MKILNSIFCIALMSFVFASGAWAAKPGSSETDSRGKAVLPDSMFFWKQDTVHSFNRWFISIGGGIGRLMAEDSRKLPFWREIEPMWTVSAGAWISPAWGIRAQAGGGRLQGFALWSDGDPGSGGGNWFLGENYPNPIGRDKFNTYLEAARDADPAIRAFIKNNYLDLDKPRVGKDGSKGYNYHFSYYSVMADLMLNLNNVIGGYSGRDDFVQVIPFAGFGWARTQKDGILPKINHIAVRGGLTADMRLTNWLRFNVESYVMVVPEVFDRYVGGDKTHDAVFALTAGLTYKFGKAKIRNCVNRYYKYHLPAPPPSVAEPGLVVPDGECLGVQISGLVYDTYDSPIGNATVFVYDIREQTATVLRTEDLGAYLATVPCGARLVIKAVKNGYMDDCLFYVAPSSDRGGMIYQEVPLLRLARLEKNKIIGLENIHYDFDKWNIRPDAAVGLDKAVRFLQQNPYIFVELGSHTDSRGTYAYNEWLSEKRSKSAVAYIVNQGISSERITARWYGERQLLEDCPDGVPCTEEQHQLNRRTELKVVNEGLFRPQLKDPWAGYVTGGIYRIDELPVGFFDECKPDKE